jgi:hypothetical protein
MKYLVATIALVLAYQAQAQVNQGNNLQAVPVQAEPVVVQAQPMAMPAGEPVIAPGQASGNPIYILNNQRQGVAQATRQNAIQEQPVSVVQDSPLKVSPADQMRKHRQDSEAQTEDGIVQALEKARIEDEMRRRDKFNNAIAPVAAQSAAINGDGNTIQQVVQQPVVQQAQAVVPAPVAAPKQKILIAEDLDEEEVVAPNKSKDEKIDIRNEIHSAMAAEFAPKEEKASYYVGALAAFGTYDGIRNVDNSMGYGFAVGTITPERWVAEGSFTYGSYQLEDVYNGNGFYPILVNMNQMNFAGAAKYQLMSGKFRPAAGALLSYTRRMYSYQGSDAFRTTDALDVGAIVGADLQVTSGFSIGFDFRYFTNMGYRTADNRQSFVYSKRSNDPEKLDYYTVNLIGKFLF